MGVSSNANTEPSTEIVAGCSSKNSTIIGSSIGAFFAGTLIAGFLGVYLATRMAKRQTQEAGPHSTSHLDSTIEWRRELDITSPGLIIPGSSGGRILTREIGGQDVRSGILKHEIDGQEVSKGT